MQIRYLSDPGKPKLPVYYLNILLPAGSDLTQIQINRTDKITLSDTAYIAPAQPPCKIGFPCDSIGPDPAVYNSITPYPVEAYKLKSDRDLYGYHIVSLEICPFEYIPGNNQLNLYRQINYTVQYSTGTRQVSNKTGKKMEYLTRDLMQSMVVK